ncbi:hypothetical protein P7K49_024648, partial [Saguinus oedipus]
MSPQCSLVQEPQAPGKAVVGRLQDHSRLPPSPERAPHYTHQVANRADREYLQAPGRKMFQKRGLPQHIRGAGAGPELKGGRGGGAEGHGGGRRGAGPRAGRSGEPERNLR